MSKAPDLTKPPKLVVIGNGMAARRVLEEFFELSPHHYQVTVFGAEPRVYYNRVMTLTGASWRKKLIETSSFTTTIGTRATA